MLCLFRYITLLGRGILRKIESIGFLLAVCIAAMVVVYSCGGGTGGGEKSEGLPSDATEIDLGVLHAASTTSLNGNWCAEGADDPGKRFLPLTSSFHLLPPLGAESGNKANSDPALTDHLIVSVCQVADNDSCAKIEEFTSQANGKGLAYIKLEGYQYHVNWKITQDLIGKELEIHFFLGDLALAFASYTPPAPRSLPIKFRIDNNPFIRAYVLQLKGMTATQIAEQLTSEFTLSAIEIAWILKTLGYGVNDLCFVLRDVLGISDTFEIENVFESLCIPQEEYLALTALETVKRFAPVLKFDRAHKGLPMSADVYFNAMMTPMPDDPKGTITWSAGWNGPPQGNYWDSKSGLYWAIESVCGRDECNNGMSNNNFQTLTTGKVPTYYRVISDKEVLGQGRLRIVY